ncbi:universal stress protein [Streptomyces sp. NPDC049577]|uniref:universal stress protein n=1 Tax=Streptomyces sp. NPDC049577 TaxID=3155153 RepID=UPI0034299BED
MGEKRGYVLAEVSDRPAGEHAVRWAADEAALRGLALRLIHFREVPDTRPRHAAPATRAAAWATHLHAREEVLLLEARDTALRRDPRLEVRTELLRGRPARVLREAAASASLLVLGTPRRSGAASLFEPRDEADALVGHLFCPVVLVREPSSELPADAPVVVGVGGSPSTAAALDLAFEEARLRGAGLVAVAVRGSREAGREELPAVLARHAERHPGVEVRQEVLTGDPAAMLASASRSARCLVVGTRGDRGILGKGGLKDLLYGSTCHTLIHGTDCTLIIAPLPPRR